jgi:broad specificity phosphatase PhoE
MLALYVTHPQVRMDPNVPVPLWGLSEEGRRRAEAFSARGVIPSGAPIFSSNERKAVELAEIIAAVTGSVIVCEHAMGENDRSATGFLPPELFEATADRFFGQPQSSVDGWERAIDAQARIVDAVETALAGVSGEGPVVFCGHGAVGTLLKCHIAGRAISRAEDQGHAGPGGGNGFVFDLAASQLHSEWTRIEDIAPGWHQR